MTRTYQLQAIPNGVAGIRETLRIMSKITKQYKANPLVRELALRLTAGLNQKDWRGEVTRIHDFVRDRIRYIKDIRGIETIHTPVELLKSRQGDCDDKSILAASLLEAIGHPTRFVAVGFNKNGTYSHVFTQTKIGNNWVTLETTEPWPLGRTCRGITDIMTQHN